MDILFQIRNITQPHHRKTENLLGFLLGSKVTTEDLAWLLKRLYTFYLPLETSLHTTLVQCRDPWLEAISYEDRLHTLALQSDLESLGVLPKDLELEAICTNLPNLNTPAERKGYLYVIEGSTLGGRIISAHLEKTLGAAITQDLKFFSGYGTELGRRWNLFKDTLRCFCDVHPDEANAVFTSAKDTFEKLGAWLGGPKNSYSEPQITLNRAVQ